MVVEVKRGGRVAYKCNGCGKQIAKGEGHFRAGGKDGFKRFHAACVDKAKVVKAEKTPKTVKAAKTPKTAKTVKATKPAKKVKATKPVTVKPAVDLTPSEDPETDADEAAAEAAALAAAAVAETGETDPKIAE